MNEKLYIALKDNLGFIGVSDPSYNATAKSGVVDDVAQTKFGFG